MTIGPGFTDRPEAYAAANGMEAAPPGVGDTAISRDPSASTVAGSVDAEAASIAAYNEQLMVAGSTVGMEITLPPA